MSLKFILKGLIDIKVYKRQQRPFIDREIVGLHGENVAIQYFSDNDIKFEDMRYIREYQRDEIDFITYAKGKKQTVEVKTSEKNIHKYNSIMVKINSEYDDLKEKKRRGSDAYLFRTKADYLFYVCGVSNDIIVVDTKKLKECISANLHTLKVVTYQDNENDRSRARYDRKNTVVYVPLSMLENGSKRIKTNYKLKISDYNFSSKRQ